MLEYCILEDRAIIKISGTDSARFLQALITNDLNLLESQASIYSLFLNPQGRFLFDAFIVKYENSYLLDVNKEHSVKFLHRMNFYKLRSNVNLEILESHLAIYSTTIIKNTISFKDPRYNAMGYRSIVNSADISGEFTPFLYLTDKYKYCIPDGFTDFIYEKTLPPEYSADKLHAISYSKGCYTGQEVISRAKYQGEVRKQLYKIEFYNNDYNNPVEKDIYQNSNKIGRILSSWQNLAIALLRINLVNLEEEVEIEKMPCGISIPEWIKE